MTRHQQPFLGSRSLEKHACHDLMTRLLFQAAIIRTVTVKTYVKSAV
jgi:hypothetical protein